MTKKNAPTHVPEFPHLTAPSANRLRQPEDEQLRPAPVAYRRNYTGGLYAVLGFVFGVFILLIGIAIGMEL